MKRKLITSLALGLCLVPVFNTQLSADTIKQDKLIDGSDMDLFYSSEVTGVSSLEDLYNEGYLSMYYPNGKEVQFDTSGDQYTFMSYFNNVQVQEFDSSYRITFGFATSISGAESTSQYGSFIAYKGGDTTIDPDHDWDTLTPEVDVQTPDTGAKQDLLIDGNDMDLHYTSVVSGVSSIEDLYNQGYISMYYPNGKEVQFDTSGDQYTFMSYFNNVQVQEFDSSYRITFGFATSISGAESTNQYGSFIVNK